MKQPLKEFEGAIDHTLSFPCECFLARRGPMPVRLDKGRPKGEAGIRGVPFSMGK